ncbi:endonuclease NucS domain-containing protein [Mongoliimonas terrestris]|uniref:endonuclease NucS domain-containing protein n=1 Tax=Mongoliimonas terrestris TaxID=1709001 RepID=UPI00094985E6|nr:endonuclease NucS domain-containing protein [Mongoliimonas terrestris]
MRTDYREWLVGQEYAENTIAAQMHRVQKVEQAYGDLEQALAQGLFDVIVQDLTYSTQDEKFNRPNPSKMSFDGNIRKNLQSYKNAALLYRKYLLDIGDLGLQSTVDTPLKVVNVVQKEASLEKQHLSLERDMQAALRKDILRLQPDLTIIDDGVERGVASGFIDILCRDGAGRLVVIELKAGKTDARVLGQILGYMGDIMSEEQSPDVLGIIVASDFDQRTLSAVRVLPNVKLCRYSIRFDFDVVVIP